ncbi:MAG: hypothetical protein ACJAS9_000754 [Polaribacter sp.]|jgi:hypothetical protein
MKKAAVFYMDKRGFFALTKPIDGEAAYHANGGMGNDIAFLSGNSKPRRDNI